MTVFIRFFIMSLLAVNFLAAVLRTETIPAASFSPVTYNIVIDAGHGGVDGGAVSLSGVQESHINLSVALKLEDTLALFGIAPQMLRREDISLHSSDADTIREKKRSDLHNRTAMIDQIQDPILISIHQNTFPQPQYHGAQVFYAATPLSQEIGQRAQQDLSCHLDPSNQRQAKKIPETIYLLNHISCPAILVECGFLSNPAEEKLLLRDDYQRKIAATLAGTILTFFTPITTLQETLS